MDARNNLPLAAHREEQAQRFLRFHAFHVDHAVAVGCGQVAGFAQGADQLGQHGAAGAREGRGAQSCQGQGRCLRSRHKAVLGGRGGHEAGALHGRQQAHQGGLGHVQPLRQLRQRGWMLGARQVIQHHQRPQRTRGLLMGGGAILKLNLHILFHFSAPAPVVLCSARALPRIASNAAALRRRHRSSI
jgi:hypothetical protein